DEPTDEAPDQPSDKADDGAAAGAAPPAPAEPDTVADDEPDPSLPGGDEPQARPTTGSGLASTRAALPPRSDEAAAEA
ncbi:MAG: hypothetical protein VKI81_12655, partial [Synechococcaceae cyanobacterium]|nr:hypothetical protein [Synechococcaceae cyanobacterium]